MVLALPEWPASYADLKPLQQVILPEGVEVVVLLPGWPPTQTLSPRHETVRKSKTSRIPSARGTGGACQTRPVFSVCSTSPPSPTSQPMSAPQTDPFAN